MFKKGDKVIYIHKDFYSTYLTFDKVYEVSDYDNFGYVQVVNDVGIISNYISDFFVELSVYRCGVIDDILE